MDTIDKSILEMIQNQGRVTNVELARMNGLAPSSMLERVRRLEERGYIKGYRAVLDPTKLGYNLQALVLINLDRHQAGSIDEFEDRVRAVPEVKSCFHVTGQYDYLLHVVVRDIDHLGALIKHTLASFAGVKKQETLLALSVIKEDQGYSLEALSEPPPK